ncbi:hypothetical protein [Niallia sp. MER 6]|uniref:hypothetical protein n=1 Tax=Niallia sp. MER 6 TaxID=2939567 RepID=UPI00203CEAD5|nr:hypothetical protein [Niallia sp. MER 6]MCM3032500.1 hypothetical protein [Niallia sp. MER 6]
MVTLFIRCGMILLSWSTIFFLPRKSFLKFLPVTIFSTAVLLIEDMIGRTYKLWKVKGGKKSATNNALTFILGPFFAANLWTFHFTYGRFWIYTIFNLVFDLLFAFPLHYFLNKIGLYKLKKVKPIFLFYTAFAYSMLNYGFQIFLDKNFTVKQEKH